MLQYNLNSDDINVRYYNNKLAKIFSVYLMYNINYILYCAMYRDNSY